MASSLSSPAHYLSTSLPSIKRPFRRTSPTNAYSPASLSSSFWGRKCGRYLFREGVIVRAEDKARTRPPPPQGCSLLATGLNKKRLVRAHNSKPPLQLESTVGKDLMDILMQDKVFYFTSMVFQELVKLSNERDSNRQLIKYKR